MVFWGQIQNYMMRVNLSILIVAMVKDQPVVKSNTTSDSNLVVANLTCMANRNLNDGGKTWKELMNEKSDEENKFDWDAITRGHVLGAHSIGYLFTQIIGE